ncbi:arginine--tRNA ligase [Porphyromonas cangingivalis]|uniref:Arginine--tRNA ligase n=1 Tax=Porphyromonas cangingivalis TaxID=36874 RepID=A0A1T4LWV2_PORCN|nr:arginine--tRNA ligase [Porphyromonas cangingivalis]SJZ59137.1 arginyl-tRNA synthetase [Porphyromonas cangingivalis]VEJ01928.1 Arginine--tRNA ligase [Porphyromonas cangingivalis]
MSQYNIEARLQSAITKVLNDLYGIEVKPETVTIQTTKKEFEGHYTLVVFPYLKASKKSPEMTATEVGEALLAQTDLVDRFNVVKGFLNLVLAQHVFIDLLRSAATDESYGITPVSEDAPLCMVEYSSPNTNKPLHLGHVRNNFLGYSVAQILKANGKRVVKTNIVNDRGIHICKSMLAWKKWGDNATPQSTGIKGDHLVGNFYVLWNTKFAEETKPLIDGGMTKEEAETQSSIMAETRQMLKDWEEGKPEVIEMWKMMNEWVYEGFGQTYKRMGVDFDKIYYESDTYLVGKDEVLRGLREGLFVQDPDGSVWADLTGEGYDRKILLRSDGTSVYMTQDIGTAKMRYQDYTIDQMIYVVGNEQNYHFEVLSKLLDKLGFEFGKTLKHFSYGMVELPEGKLKSREGKVVDADNLMDDMAEQAYLISKNAGKGTDMSEAESREVARIVSLGALKYFLLKVDPKRSLLFNPEESIDFNGNTGPFIQYTYARIRSIERRAAADGTKGLLDLSIEVALPTLSDKELMLIRRINEFPSIVEAAGSELSPALIANYTYELVKEYNQFYHDHSILNEPDDVKKALRLTLSSATAKIIKSAMELLGIEVPERM